MSKAIKILLFVSVTALIPFIYFWVRDVPDLREIGESNGCIPYELTESIDRFSIKLDWKTESECVGYLKYSLNTNGSNWITLTGTEEFNLMREHSIKIDDLKPGTYYYVTIISDGENYGKNGTPLRFKTSD